MRGCAVSEEPSPRAAEVVPVVLLFEQSIHLDVKIFDQLAHQ